MKPPATEKYRVWLAVLVLAMALLAGWWANRSTQPEAPPPPSAPASAGSPAPPPAKAPPPPHGPATLPPAQHAEAAPPVPDKVVDVFAVHTWEPPPPPPSAAAPGAAPPPPQAPPLPFRFLGRIAEPGEAPVFLLAQGDRVLPAKLGDRIGGAYRLEKFEGGQLYFRYRPMNVVQTLPAGSAQ